MKKRIVLWGVDGNEQKILIAAQLLDEENKVKIITFPEQEATEEFYNVMMNAWRNETEVPFPESHTVIERDLSVTESLLPDDIKALKTDIVNRAKTEWHFIVLSSKLYRIYHNELGEFKEKVGGLSKFDKGVWDEMKGFWIKVQDQVREKNLFREHANELRDGTNSLFDRLKELRKDLDKEFREGSETQKTAFLEKLTEIKGKIDKGLGLKPIFEELKTIQSNFNKTKFTKKDRSDVWDLLDEQFKKIKQIRFGDKPGDNKGSGSNALDRLNRRYSGLMNAIHKMQRSIERDNKDLEFENKRIGSSSGQLEQQIRQAKTMMIKERANSKKEKLDDMLKTKADLDKKIEQEKVRVQKRAEQEKIKQTEAALKEKIAEKIESEKSKIPENQKEELTKAAEEIKAGKAKKKTKVAKADAKEATTIESTPEIETKEDSTTKVVAAAAVTAAVAAVSSEVKEEVKKEATAVVEEKLEATDKAKEVVEKIEEEIKAEPVVEDKSSIAEGESFLSAAGSLIGESLEDLGDTIKAVANIAKDKLEDKIEDLIGEEE